MTSKELTPEELARMLAANKLYVADIKTQVMELYVGFLGRAADQAGLSYWVNKIFSGSLSFEDLRASFATPLQREYWDIYGTLNNHDLTVKIYNNLLNREPEAAGLSYWVAELDSGRIAADQFINAILNAVKDQEKQANAGRLLDIATLNNKVSAANYFTQESQQASAYSDEFKTKARNSIKDVSSDIDSVGMSKAQTDIETKTLENGSNKILGTPGDDTFKLSGDYIWIEPGDGSDTIIIEGTSKGALSYWNASSGVTVDLQQGTSTGSSVGDTFTDHIMHVRGSAHNDTLTGGNPANDEREVFEGLGGNDIINGGSGYDVLRYYSTYATGTGIVADFSKGTVADRFAGTDVISGIELVIATLHPDTFIGSNTVKKISFIGLAGEDNYQGVIYNETTGTGYEHVDYSEDAKVNTPLYKNNHNGVNVDLSANTATDGFGHIDTLINIDHITATEYDDILKGDSANNTFDGLDGNDTFVFSNDWGVDRISDFSNGHNILDLSATGLMLSDLLISYDVDDNELSINSGDNTIILTGVISVDASDFIFS